MREGAGIALVILLAVIIGAVYGWQETLAGPVTEIADGDTLTVAGDRVRLHGVDAPERSQRCMASNGQRYSCGESATRHLASLVGREELRCAVIDTDRYGRKVARCMTPAGRDVGRELVRSGMAVAYRRYSEIYVPDEDSARAARRGLWQGGFQMPWEYRTGRR